MKKILYVLFSLTFIIAISKGQTATDFTAVDCNSNTHNLFTELNAGKVIVLDWVMPCINCVAPSLSTSNVVQSYQSTYPGRVFLYLLKDIGTTTCSTLNNWAANNGIQPMATFNSPVAAMTDYGYGAMPKVVVLGGSSHSVFYVGDAGIDVTSLQNAINAALAATGINEPTMGVSSMNVFPNPATNATSISFSLEKTSDVKAELFNIEGQMIKNIFDGKLSSGENKIFLDLSKMSVEIYFAKLSIADKNKIIKLVIAD